MDLSTYSKRVAPTKGNWFRKRGEEQVVNGSKESNDSPVHRTSKGGKPQDSSSPEEKRGFTSHPEEG